MRHSIMVDGRRTIPTPNAKLARHYISFVAIRLMMMSSFSASFRNTWLISLLALQIFPTSSNAQNLTLTFSPSSAGTCSTPANASSSGGITFTTSSTPCAALCINLAAIFQGESSGVIIHDGQGLTCPNEISNITYYVSNQDSFDQTANYSRVYYHHTAPAGPILSNQEVAENQALRLVSFWSAVDCRTGINEDGDVGERVEPYYVQDCVSEGDEGQCNTAAVGVKSVLIVGSVNAYEDPREGTCRSFGYDGDGTSFSPRRSGIVMGIVVAMSGALL